MKNTLLFGIIAFIVVIGSLLVACDVGGIETVGSLTITGIPAEFNGKYALAHVFLEENEYFQFIAAANLNTNGFILSGSAGLINNGSVTLKVWEQIPSYDGFILKNFNASGNAYGGIAILESANFSFNLFDDHESDIISQGYIELTFNNGVGSGAFVKY